jgi:gas vesicle protein
MTDDESYFEVEPRSSQADRGGFVALAVIAAAAGAGAALLLAPEAGSRTRQRVGQGLRDLSGEAADTVAELQRQIRARKHHARQERRMFALAGFLVGAGLAALLTPESGATTRKVLGGTLSRIKVGAVDRLERLRRTDAPNPTENPVRSVQELGRDPEDIF